MKLVAGALKALSVLALMVAVVLVPVLPALGQSIPAPTDPSGQKELLSKYAEKTGGSYIFTGNGIGAAVGAGLTIVGAGLGFARIGAAALESMARQPEVAGRVQTAMLIIAALLEGATFFALIVCIQVAGRTGLL